MTELEKIRNVLNTELDNKQKSSNIAIEKMRQMINLSEPVGPTVEDPENMSLFILDPYRKENPYSTYDEWKKEKKKEPKHGLIFISTDKHIFQIEVSVGLGRTLEADGAHVQWIFSSKSIKHEFEKCMTWRN